MPRSDSVHAAGGSNTLPRGTRLDEFEITGLIGQGGFGIVYLAYDHSLRRTVALKEYMPSDFAARTGTVTVAVKSQRHAETFQAGLKSFINEAQLLARFDHPSLVKVYRFWEANGTAYMVMPFYDGPTLEEALRKLGGPPSEVWLKNLLRPLIDALAILHGEQCLHRDIAPDNILILKTDRPVLLDFGAARRRIGDMTRALTVIVKTGYAPIEQYAEVSSMGQGAWTDIYALGAVVYEAIVGEAPMPSVARLMSDPLKPLSVTAAGRYSERFLKAIEKALAVRPEDRPQDIAEFRALLGLNDALPIPKRNRGEWKKRRIAVLSIGAVFILAISGAAYFLTQEKPATSRPEEPFHPGQPFTPGRMLDMIFEGRNRQHAVTASVDRAQVRIGRDQLRFSIGSSKPGHVYVFVVGTNHSDFYLLFPNAFDKDNLIAAGATLTLPRPLWPMKAKGPPGTDQFLAIVSDEPRDFSSLGGKPDDIFIRFPLETSEQLYRAHSEPAPLFAGKTACSARSDCSPLYGAAVFSIEEVAEPESR